MLNSKLKSKNLFALSFSFTLFALSFTLFTTPIIAQSKPTSSPTTEEATSPAKSVRDTLKEKVEEKLTQLANKPRALIGKLTDIQDGSLLIETKTVIKQLKLNENTKIIDNRDDAKKNLETKDLVIGNQVIAMGWTDTKDVLDTKRILVAGALPVPTKKAIHGIVEDLKKDSIVIKNPKKDETWTVKIDSKTRITAMVDGKIEKTTLSEVSTDNRIVTIGTLSKEANTILAKLVHIIPGKAVGADTKNSPSPSPTPKARPSIVPSPTPTQN